MVLATAAFAVGWLWFAFAYFEEWSEQCKAIAASTTMDGLGATLGMAPLIGLHVVILALLIGMAWRGRIGTRVIIGLSATAVASAVALLVAQSLLTGTVFTYSAQSAVC